MMIWAILAAAILAGGISYFGVTLAGRAAVRLDMIDHPERHKAHAQATPLLGGCAIVMGIVLPSLLALAVSRLWASGVAPAWVPEALARHIPGVAHRAPQALGILLAALGLHVLGLLDDRRHLGPWVKLGVQILAAAWVVLLCDVRVLTLAGPAVSITATILWIVLMTNSFNFLDNMDGLAAGVAAICAGALLAASLSMGQWFVAAWSALLLGSLLGFLPHNFPPAKIFMGDAGSLVIGFLLAVVSALTTYVHPEGDHLMYGVLAPAVLMAIPIYDTASVIWIRLREGRNPMIGDRRHFSHRLVQRGMTPRTAVLTIYCCTAGTAIAAILLPHVRGVFPPLLLLVQVVLILMVISLLEAAENR